MCNPPHQLVPVFVHRDVRTAQNVVAVGVVAAAVATVVDPAIDCTLEAGEFAVDAFETRVCDGLRFLL